MGYHILMIDAEQPFADDIASALQDRGLDVEVVADGKDGLERTRELDPSTSVVVLCVELPKTSGYSICNKLKKDSNLKQIPLIITSREATPETFEQHKKLKTRADGYLIKPFDVDALYQQLSALVPLELSGEAVIDLSENDIETGLGGEDGFDLSNLASEIEDSGEFSLEDGGISSEVTIAADGLDLSSLDGSSLGLEPLDTEAVSADAELNLDEAFDGLPADEEISEDVLSAEDLDAELIETGAGDALDPGEPDDFDTGADSKLEMEEFDAAVLDEPAETHAPATVPPPRAASPSTERLAAESARVGELEKQVRELRRQNNELNTRALELETRLKVAEDEARKKSNAVSEVQSSASTSQRDLLAIKQQLHEKEKELFKLKEENFAKEKESFEAQEKLAEERGRAERAEGKVADRDATIVSLNAKVDALTDERDTIERESSERIRELERKVVDLESTRDDLQRRLESSERTAAERAERIDELSKDLREKEATIDEMYLKSKADEKIRKNALKAVEVANGLLSGKVTSDEDVERSVSELSIEM